MHMYVRTKSTNVANKCGKQVKAKMLEVIPSRRV